MLNPKLARKLAKHAEQSRSILSTWPQWRDQLTAGGSGGQKEQLLHHELGRGETEGRGAAHDPRGFRRAFTVLGGRVW
jgi:hypothetical protein